MTGSWGNGGKVDVDAVHLTYRINGHVQAVHGTKGKQVEFHDSHRGAVVLVPLEHRAVLHPSPFERHDLPQWPLGHHHSS